MSAITDVTEQINRMHRGVRGRVVDGANASTVVLSRSYEAPVDEVWDACTNPERIPRWFLPVTGELRLGGSYQLKGNAGGTVERCEPPHSFRISWEFGGTRSRLELRLQAEGGDTTRLELEHIAAADNDKWAQFGPGALGVGWDLGLMGLGLHLESGRTADPLAAVAWSASEEGKRYVTLSSEAWADAAIAAGGDPDEARAAAAHTTAFYTGVPAASSPSS